MKKLKIYKCDLLSITEGMKVYNGYSKPQNIQQAVADDNIQSVERLYVQPVDSKYMKEIITKELIPIYRIQITAGGQLDDIVEQYPPAWVCFIKYTEEMDMDMYRENSLEEANADEIQEYYNMWHGEEDSSIMHDRLEELFIRGEEYYQTAAKNPVPSEEEIKERLVSANPQHKKTTILQKIKKMYH